MDPLTAVGVAASIVQLSQAAFSLSKTLYSLGSALASVPDDIQVLASDLRTFSQSLTILSRLLEDNKSRYSDDVYLMTARIIKDSADLYIKIDKFLRKLGGNSNWKLRIKFVYKEGEIRKLMDRLRDMKGTLATILMSLQVDLQLSLLNISSPSKIQRPPENPLRPDTIQTLVEAKSAQKTAMQTYFLTIYSVNSDQFMSSSSERQEMESTSSRGIEGSYPAQAFHAINLITPDHTNHQNMPAETLTVPDNEAGSLRSASSVETFQSAISVQESIDIALQVEAVCDVLHSFRTALEVLAALIETRLRKKEKHTYAAAKELEDSLAKGEKEITELHNQHRKRHGLLYTTGFTASHTTNLRNVSSTLLKDIVVELHASSAKHVKIQSSDFESMRTCSEQCNLRTTSLISMVASQINISNTAKQEPEMQLCMAESEPRRFDKLSSRFRLKNWLRATPISHIGPTRFKTDGKSAEDLAEVSSRLSERLASGSINWESIPSETVPTQATSQNAADSWHRRKLARPLMSIATYFDRAVRDRFDDSAFKNGEALDFPEIPGEEKRNRILPQIRTSYDDNNRPASVTGSVASKTATASGPKTVDCRDHGDQEMLFSPFRSTGRKELTSLYRFLSQDPFQKLWLEAYNSFSSSQTAISDALRNSLMEKLDSGFSNNSDGELSEALTSLAKKTGMNEHPEATQGLKQVIEQRNNIIKVMMTISSHLGLSRPAIGWTCVVVLLEIYEDVFDLIDTHGADIIPAKIEGISNSFFQLDDLVGLLARYAVMENVYYKLPAWTFSVKYRTALLDICQAILAYFAYAFMTANILRDLSGDEEEAVRSREWCNMLVELIKEKDRASRKFRVIVEADEKSGTDVKHVEAPDDSELNCDEYRAKFKS